MLILSKRLFMVYSFDESWHIIFKGMNCTVFWFLFFSRFHKTLVIIIQQKQAIIVIDAATAAA